MAKGEAAIILIRNGYLITMDAQGRTWEDGAVAVQGDHIVAAGPSAEVEAKVHAEVVIEARQKAILPGFVNAHGHTFQTLYRGFGRTEGLERWGREIIWPLSGAMGRDEARAAAMLACLEMIKSGTTTFVDSHFIHGNRDCIEGIGEAVEQAGMRAIIGRASLDSGDWCPFPGNYESPATAVRECADLIKRWHGRAGGRIRVRPEPLTEVTASPELIRALRQLSREAGTGMNMHIAEIPSRVEFLKRRHGASPMQYLYDLGALGPDVLLAHCVWLTAKDIAYLKETDTKVAHNPVANQYFGDGVAPVPQMRARGVTVALGTDGAASNDSLDMFGVMKACVLMHRVAALDSTIMTAADALDMVTRAGARALGLEAEIGSLEVGKKADLILVDLRRPEMVPLVNVRSHLALAATGAAVDSVIVDGRIVMRDRRVTTLDETAVLDEAEAAIGRLMKAAGFTH